ncbi:hypothetical protein COOONC_14712 [Cooperia oncophora]
MSMPETAKWVSALSDEQAGVFTFSHCVCLSDMYGDGDTKLVLAHVGSSRFNMRLKVFKGVTVVGENALADMPTAIVSFYNEKYNTPSAPVHKVEQEAWTKTCAKQLTQDQLFTVIQSLANEVSMTAE